MEGLGLGIMFIYRRYRLVGGEYLERAAVGVGISLGHDP